MAKAGRKPGTPKTGGRKPGTPNRTTQALADRIKERMGPDWCPITAMAELAEAKDLPVDLRLRALAEVAPYLHAKRKPQPEIEEAAALAEEVQAARMRAMRTGGVGLETLVLWTGVNPPDPAAAPFVPPLAIPPAQAAPPAAPLPPLRMPSAWSDDDGTGSAAHDHDPFTRN